MSRGAQLRVSSTRTIPFPNYYVAAIYGEFAGLCFDEEAAPKFRGHWREQAFSAPGGVPLDLEIGTGNGTHFAHRSHCSPERLILGIELKYKPLIQTIRRSIRLNCKNSRVARYNAALPHEMFVEGELDNVYIHFPDPWSKTRQHKHRLLQTEFLDRLFLIQKPGSFVEFKTDNRAYFDWALEKMDSTKYIKEAVTFDLHKSEYAQENFRTQFENIFLREGLPIHMARLRRL